ncbi:MAG: Na/Pi symporter [Campylobacter sp.]|nr:Na/Pi symporter [Campylobacter sp.]
MKQEYNKNPIYRVLYLFIGFYRFVGTVIFILNKQKQIKGFGYFLFSIGLLFLGIAYIKEGFEEIKESVDLVSFGMSGYKGVLVYTIVGFVITIITQSSHATIAIAITALAGEQISYENALAITIGSNVGSTIMAFLGSLGSNIEGKRLMAGHLLFNITSAIVTIVLIYPLMSFVDISSELFGIKADDYTLKLALFHTYFNAIGVLIFYPINSKVVKLLERIIKAKDTKKSASVSLYLKKEALNYANSAKEVLILETKHLYTNTMSIIAKTLSLNANDLNSNLSEESIIYSKKKTTKIDFDKLYDDRFKSLYNDIIDFSMRADKTAQNEEDTKIFISIRRGSLRLAEILKDIKNIYPNLNRFLNSSNEYIKDEYNKLRIKAFKSINITNSSLKLNEPNAIEAKSLELEKIIKSYDLVGKGRMNELLDKDFITSSMATSLMNDTLMMRNVSINLQKIIQMNYNYYKHKSSVKIENQSIE